MVRKTHGRRRRRVTIVFPYVPHYRAHFCDLLRESLHVAGIELSLCYGDPVRDFDRLKGDAVSVPWAKRITTVVVPFRGSQLYWQPCLRYALCSDLVIVGHSNKMLVNYFLLLAQAGGLSRVAFWGHGEDSQHRGERTLNARLRRWTAHRARWWFTHTTLSAEVLQGHGTDSRRITVVNNAIDATPLVRAARSSNDDSIQETRRELGIRGERVCAYLGSLYPAKRLPFLIASAELMRRRIPDFELIIIGDGPDRKFVESASADMPWIHYVGPRFGVERARYLAASKLLLIPGAIGLVILDSFALAVPVVTTSVPTHGPEIAYLRHGINGVMVSDFGSEAAYADAVSALLEDVSTLDELRAGCIDAQGRYTLEDMVRRFTRGVIEALER